MPELTHRSAGVSTREIDTSGPRAQPPVGIPAGVIATSNDGPAFVPVTIGSFSDFVRIFGGSDGEKFGPLAVNEWLKNAGSCTFLRVLGCGNGKKRNSDTGRVANAGFVVGAKQVQGNGIVATSTEANTDGMPGRTYFLGCFMSESAGSTVFSSAGIQNTAATSGKTATAVNAIDTDGAAAGIAGGTDVEFTINVPASAGGEGGIVTIVLEDGDDTGAAGAAANQIGIGGNSGLGDASWQNLVLAAINNDTSSGRITMATSGRGTAGITGVTATNGTSNTQTTLTVDQGGSAGNSTVLASTEGVDIIDVTSFTGGLDGNHAVPIVRGIIMAASGVLMTLSGNACPASGKFSSTPPDGATVGSWRSATVRGGMTGSLRLTNQEFVLFLNGHKGKKSTKRVLTASMDMRSPNYFAHVLNTDPFKIEETGHYMYGHYDIHPALAATTGSGVIKVTAGRAAGTGGYNDVVFITSGSGGHNAGTATKPNYENFEDRFETAFSPYVFTQNFGGVPYNLFRVHSLSDGSAPTVRFKMSVENIKKSTSDDYKFGSFDLVVRDFNDTDDAPIVVEAFRGCSLDRNSERYVARVVGDQRTYFDFDQNSGAQKLVVVGDHPNRSQLVRVEVSTALGNGEVPSNGLPMGFRGPYHTVTSGSTPLIGLEHEPGATAGPGRAWVTGSDYIKGTIEPPIPFRDNVTLGTGVSKRAKSMFYWGVQFDRKENPTEPNKVALPDPSIKTFAQFYPRFEGTSLDFSVGNNAGKASVGGVVLDSDVFNNNKFTLENVKVKTGSDGLADVMEWSSASYVRKGSITADTSTKTRALKVEDLKHSANRNYAKFSFFLQGGFNGTNIFNEDLSKLTNASAVREMNDETNQGGIAGSTVGSFRKATDIMGNITDVTIKLLAIPGMRDTGITDYAISAVESRFDALYIMDIEERDTLNTVVTGSVQNIHVQNTVSDFLNRALNTSFASAYFPDVITMDPMTLTNVQVPASVVVLGAFALNDSIGHPWFAPAGFTRGALPASQRAAVELNRQNLDDLYDADINPITDFPGTGLVVFGQKTLLAAASALDRVNVRRLLIEIRRSVRSIANLILFEPNRESTLEKFSALVNPILQGIQEQSGVDRYKVVIDTTTTTQADIENNTIRGKIFLQPTRTVEFIALDFEVTNAGGTI